VSNSGEAAAVTDEQEPRRRCLGANQNGEPCGVGPELVLDDGYCFSHSPRPGRAEKQSAAGTLGAIKAAARRRKGLDPDKLGALETAADAMRITALLTLALATGELPAAAGRAALVGLQAWLQARDQDEMERRIAELEARERRP